MRYHRFPENGKIAVMLCPECKRLKKNNTWVTIPKEKLEELCKDFVKVDFIIEICDSCLQNRTFR